MQNLFLFKGYSGEDCREDNKFVPNHLVFNQNSVFMTKNVFSLVFMIFILIIVVSLLVLILRRRFKKSQKRNFIMVNEYVDREITENDYLPNLLKNSIKSN